MDDWRWKLLTGDCRTVLADKPEHSIDAIVTDPPYGLEFMEKAWDKLGKHTVGSGRKGKPGIGDRPTEWVSSSGWNGFRCRNCGHLGHGGSPCACDKPDFGPADDRWLRMQLWHEAWAREALRVLKPGGHLLAFGGSRTFHRLAVAIEDAGFELRDTLSWLYGQGMPKHKTMLKPGWEAIVLARKPCQGSERANIAKWGVGGLFVEDCRLGNEPRVNEGMTSLGVMHDDNWQPRKVVSTVVGRWPANVLLDEEAAALLDDQVGERAPGNHPRRRRGIGFTENGGGRNSGTEGVARPTEAGGASRFFYTSKASRRERDAGLADFPATTDHKTTGRGLSNARPRCPEHDGVLPSGANRYACGCEKVYEGEGSLAPYRNNHPTVKPVDLLRHLVRLVSPEGGLVLDPFAGSGSTGLACLLEGRRFVGVELSTEYARIAEARLRHVEASGERWLTAA